jgi:uncharacterized membrane protein YqiK
VTIKAREDAERDQIAADRDAYVETKKANAKYTAAEQTAAAVKAEAEGRASALRAKAEGERDALKTEADAYAYDRTARAEAEFEAADKEANAKIKLAEATLKEGEAIAESERLLQEARNSVSDRLLMQEVMIEAVKIAPEVAAQVAGPLSAVAEKIQIVQVSGGNESGDSAGGIPGTIMTSAAQAVGILPILRQLVATPEAQDLIETAKTAAREAVTEVVNGAVSPTVIQTAVEVDGPSNGVGHS